MCMMKQNGAKESCEVAKNLAALDGRVESLDARVDGIDQRVTRIESNMTSGFNTVTTAVNQLAADFGSRMNTLDQRIVEEKAKENERKYAEQVKWGEVKRNIATWAARLILLGCASAMGMTAYKMIFGN